MKKNALEIINLGNDLPAEALEIFATRTQKQQVYITIDIAEKELCTLKFDLEDLEKTDFLLTHAVSAVIEKLLRKIPHIISVQNKL